MRAGETDREGEKRERGEIERENFREGEREREKQERFLHLPILRLYR
jgi:hypothetical protein